MAPLPITESDVSASELAGPQGQLNLDLLKNLNSILHIRKILMGRDAKHALNVSSKRMLRTGTTYLIGKFGDADAYIPSLER